MPSICSFLSGAVAVATVAVPLVGASPCPLPASAVPAVGADFLWKYSGDGLPELEGFAIRSEVCVCRQRWWREGDFQGDEPKAPARKNVLNVSISFIEINWILLTSLLLRWGTLHLQVSHSRLQWTIPGEHHWIWCFCIPYLLRPVQTKNIQTKSW